MSVLIKGAKPPKNCWECMGNDICIAIAKMGGACPFTERIIGRNKFDAHSGIHPECPLVEVPEPHGDLIDREEISVDVYEDADGFHYEVSAPTVIGSEGEDVDTTDQKEMV